MPYFLCPDCDPIYLKALQLSQYTVQYIQASNKHLQNKQRIIENAFLDFEAEEEELDFQIARLKARVKGLRRE
ncbi:hypothetical protein EON65_11565, partial [archaeon]